MINGQRRNKWPTSRSAEGKLCLLTLGRPTEEKNISSLPLATLILRPRAEEGPLSLGLYKPTRRVPTSSPPSYPFWCWGLQTRYGDARRDERSPPGGGGESSLGLVRKRSSLRETQESSVRNFSFPPRLKDLHIGYPGARRGAIGFRLASPRSALSMGDGLLLGRNFPPLPREPPLPKMYTRNRVPHVASLSVFLQSPQGRPCTREKNTLLNHNPPGFFQPPLSPRAKPPSPHAGACQV